MKFALLSILLLLTSIGRSQDTISVFSSQWAGGICCSYGNDFTVVVIRQKKSMNVDSVHVFSQGLKMCLPGSLLMNEGSFCSIRFGWRTTNSFEMENPSVGYYGIQANQISSTGEMTNHAVFFYSDGTKSEPVVIYREEYLAYP